MTRKEIQKLVISQQEKINELIGAIRLTQDSEQWRTTQIQALQSTLEALSTLPNIMNNSVKDSEKMKIKLVQLNNYRIPHEFTTEYWFRLNKWGEWWANSCEIELHKINSEDPALQRFYILTALKYSKMFSNSILYKEGNYWKPGVWTYLDLDKRIVKFTTNISSTAIQIKQQSIEFKDSELKQASLDDVIVLKNNDMNIGDYVLMIPWIGKEIFFERQMQKNLSFLNIVPSNPLANENQKGQLAPFLSNCEEWYADEPIDRQVGVNVESIKGNKLKWITPPPEIKETFEVLQNNLKFIREDFHQRFGVPVECSFNNKQHLNSDANMVVTNVEYTAKNWYNTYEDLMEQMIEIGLYDDILENIEKEMDEKFDNMKEEPKDESKKEEGKTNDVGENKEGVK